MTNRTLRREKGSELTHDELDDNFVHFTEQVATRLPADFSGLTDPGALDGTETLPINKTGAKRTTVQKVLDWIKTQAITWAAKQTISGDLEFGGVARRILGDMNNATVANRLMFQNSVLNGNTNICALPNGTGTASNCLLFAGADVANSPYTHVGMDASGALLAASRTGTGAFRPLRLQTSDTVRFEIAVAGHSIFTVPTNDGVRITDGTREGRLVPSAAGAGSLAIVTPGAYGISFWTNNTERARFLSTGNLEILPFTKLGESSPAIKVKKLTGTTAATEGGSVNVAHGLTLAKIISATVLVTASGSKFASNTVSAATGYQYDFYVGATNVQVTNHATNSENILSQSLEIFITYEE